MGGQTGFVSGSGLFTRTGFSAWLCLVARRDNTWSPYSLVGRGRHLRSSENAERSVGLLIHQHGFRAISYALLLRVTVARRVSGLVSLGPVIWMWLWPPDWLRADTSTGSGSQS